MSNFNLRYDFNNDGKLSAEDVRLIMSFLPFDHNMGNDSPDNRPEAFSEEIEKIKPKDRIAEQEEIAMFVS